jgi:hypothetical protein
MNSTAVYSTALGPLCSWTVSSVLCIGTLIPIFTISFFMMVGLIYSCRITEQSAALEVPATMQESPLVPSAFQGLDAAALKGVMLCVMDIPLKTLLPSIGLGYLVEPCSTLGVASVRDTLKLNTLALRDAGMGPKEQRIFSRALERRIRLRSRLQEAVSDVTGRNDATLKRVLDQASRSRRSMQNSAQPAHET